MPGLRLLGDRRRTIIYWDYLFHKLVKKGVICPFSKYKGTKMKGGVQKNMYQTLVQMYHSLVQINLVVSKVFV